MKPQHKYLFPILALFMLAGCDLSDGSEEIIKGDHSFYITGINESITYEFTSGNGRAAQSDEVKNLSIYIFDTEGNIAYETRFYNYQADGDIPDSILIPSLSSGTYKILALTADYYPYYDYYYQEGDTMSIFDNFIIPTYITSESPIFVGFEQIALDEETNEVKIDMKNISAKISFKLTNSSISENTSISLEVMTTETMDYSVPDGEMVRSMYDNNYLYNYIDHWMPERTIYVLPQTLSDLSIQFYDYQTGTNWNNSLSFDNKIKMEVGDAITFSLNLEAFFEGSGSGVLNYEDIVWNDLGEVTVP